MPADVLPSPPGFTQAEVLTELAAIQQELSKLQGQLQQLIRGVQQSVVVSSDPCQPEGAEPQGNAAQPPGEPTDARQVASPAKPRYDKHWTYIEKIQYVLRQPKAYGSCATLVGITGVVNAIFQEEPELASSEGSSVVWMKRFGETLSRMTKQNLFAVKMREADAAKEYHFASIDWFENGKPKPEYEEAVRNLKPLTRLKPSSKATK